MKLGISVPDEISLLGIDAIPDTVLLPYKLTHFEVPHKKEKRADGRTSAGVNGPGGMRGMGALFW